MMVGAPDSYTYTVGKLDAGMAILLGDRGQLIEFPSLLLPPGARAGSIVSIAVHRNMAEEKKRDNDFWALQDDILETFGKTVPQAPDLQLRHVTQTSATLEWPTLNLATSKIRSLDIYKNGERLAAIPSPLQNTSTKLSGLDLDTAYTFQLILRTTAGTHASNILRVQTHNMTNTSGISVCFGNVQDPVLLENSKAALTQMGAKWSDKIQIDTTHFVCTTPAVTPSGAAATGALANAPGVEYQRALQLSIPIVIPQWILACHTEKRMIPIAQFYLGSTPSPTHAAARPMSISGTPTPARSTASIKNIAGNRMSMPAPSRSSPANTTSPPPKGGADAHKKAFEPMPEEEVAELEKQGPPPQAHAPSELPRGPGPGQGHAQGGGSGAHKRTGTMQKNFKFPPSPPLGATTSATAVPPVQEENEDEDGVETVAVVAPGKAGEGGVVDAIEVAPPPVEKELRVSNDEVGDDDLGSTEEISLN